MYSVGNFLTHIQAVTKKTTDKVKKLKRFPPKPYWCSSTSQAVNIQNKTFRTISIQILTIPSHMCTHTHTHPHTYKQQCSAVLRSDLETLACTSKTPTHQPWHTETPTNALLSVSRLTSPGCESQSATSQPHPFCALLHFMMSATLYTHFKASELSWAVFSGGCHHLSTVSGVIFKQPEKWHTYSELPTKIFLSRLCWEHLHFVFD